MVKNSIKPLKKIVFFNSNFSQGGVTTYTRTLKSILSKYEIITVSGEDAEGVDYVYEVLSNPRNFSVFGFITLLKYIKNETKKGSKLVFQNSHSIIIGRILTLILGSNSLFIVHGWYWRGESRLFKIVSKILENILGIFPFNYVYVCPSAYEDHKEILLFDLYKSKKKIITNSVKPPNTIQVNKPKELINILIPMRKDRAKDHLNAFQLSMQSKENFLFAGEGVDEKYFEELIGKKPQDNCFFLGYVKDMAEQYENSDLVLLLSHFESFPLVLIEALSFGKPILASDVGDNKLIIENGINGYLIQNNSDHTQILDFIQKITKSSKIYSVYSKNAQNRYKNSFSFQRFQQEITFSITENL